MKPILLVLALLAPGVAQAGGADHRRCETKLITDCKTVTTGAGIEFFSTAYTSNTLADRKGLWVHSLGAVATNYVVISTFTNTVDSSGLLVPGSEFPFWMPISQGIKTFIRWADANVPTSLRVCATACE